MTILNISPLSPPPAPLAPQPAVRRVAPVAPVAAPLEPAVQFDVRPNLEPSREPAIPVAENVGPARDEGRVTVDTDTKSLVYQVIDPDSGDVVVQLPDAAILKARAYAETAAARSKDDAHPLDLTA